MNLGLEGKVALVTGAGVGIGRVIALTLAKEGSNVAVNDLRPGSSTEERWLTAHDLFHTVGKSLEEVVGKEPVRIASSLEEVVGQKTVARIGRLTRAAAVVKECNQLGVKAIVAEADVTNPEEVADMVNRVIGELGKIDILINNAGGTYLSDFIDSTKERWDYIINLCLYGVLNCTKAVLPSMIDRGYGKIVSITSEAWKGADRGLSVYGAAKAGISSFTRTLALEVGRYGINVNAVSPGTTMVEHSIQAWRHREQTLGKEAADQKRQRQFGLHPLAQFYGRFGQPEDVANMVVFLCSDRAKWITGQSISVSGGYHMH